MNNESTNTNMIIIILSISRISELWIMIVNTQLNVLLLVIKHRSQFDRPYSINRYYNINNNKP